MIIVYGPKPGTEVVFDLTITRPTELTLQNGKSFPLPKVMGVEGNTVKLTVRVPSDADKRELRHHLVTTRVEVLDGKDQIKVQTSKQALERFHAAVIGKLLVRLDGYQMVDPRPGIGIPPFEPHTPEEVMEFVDDDTVSAIVEVLMDRTRLSESLRGNSDGRSTSSTAATPALDGTAASAASSGSAESARAIAPLSEPTSTSPRPA